MDDRVRELERRWKASRDKADRLAWLQARIRGCPRFRARVEVAARFEYPLAMRLVEGGATTLGVLDDDVEGSVRLAYAAAVHTVRSCMQQLGYWDPIELVRAGVQAIHRWLRKPSFKRWCRVERALRMFPSSFALGEDAEGYPHADRPEADAVRAFRPILECIVGQLQALYPEHAEGTAEGGRPLGERRDEAIRIAREALRSVGGYATHEAELSLQRAIRRQTARWLLGLSDPLLASMRSAEGVAAVRAAERHAREDPSDLSRLEALAELCDAFDLRYAGQTLGEWGQALRAGDWYAADRLAETGSRAVPQLLESLSAPYHQWGGVQAWSLAALERLGPKRAGAAIPRLVDLFDEHDRDLFGIARVVRKLGVDVAVSDDPLTIRRGPVRG